MRLLSTWLLASAVILSSGCSMCAPGYLDDYATVGGKWQRSDPTNGRVGSIFSDAGETISTGAVGTRIMDGPAVGIDGEVFGEAYTEDYQGEIDEFQELGPALNGSDEFPMEPGDGELMLGDEW